MKRAEENLIIGIGIGYFLCKMMHRATPADQPVMPPTAPPVRTEAPVLRIPSRKNPLPYIGRRPWPMQNPLMYMAY